MIAIERYRTISARVARYRTLLIAEADAAALRTRTEELQPLSDQLDLVTSQLQVLVKAGIVRQDSLPEQTQLRQALQALRELLQRSPSLGSGVEYRTLRNALRQFLKDLGKILEQALVQVEHDLSPVDEVFLRQIERIPSYTERVRVIRQQYNAILQGRALRSMSADDLRDVLRQRGTLAALVAGINPAEFPASVLDFFHATRDRSGAPLGALTDEVRQWLAQRDLLRQLRIIVADS